MNRLIKFRGMDLRGRWLYGNLAILHKDLRSTGNKAGHYISNVAGAPFAYAVRPETVGQYTGDENRGYEGDILEWVEPIRGEHGDIEDFEHCRGVVEWDNERSGFIVRSTNGTEWLDDLMNITVIGNKFEHAHLLKGDDTDAN